MSTTPKVTRRERGHYTRRALQPKRPVIGSRWDDPSVEGMDRWYCRRHCGPACEAGRGYRRVSSLRSSYRHKTRNRW